MRAWLVGFSLLFAACGTSGRPEGNGSNGGGNGSTNGTSTAGTTGGGLVNPGDNGGSSPDGLTPTTAAIDAAVNYLSGAIDSDGHPKYILLATDGEPNCGSGADDNAAAEQAVANAATKGIHTFVVGIGTGNGNETV